MVILYKSWTDRIYQTHYELKFLDDLVEGSYELLDISNEHIEGYPCLSCFWGR